MTDAPVPQQWVRPEIFAAPPGHWKQQLPTKYLKIAALDKGASTSDAMVGLARGDSGKRADKIRIFLQYGADVNERGPDGRTALHYAARAGDVEVVTLLIDHGESIDMKDNQGRTALSLATAAGKQSVVEALTS